MQTECGLGFLYMQNALEMNLLWFDATANKINLI